MWIYPHAYSVERGRGTYTEKALSTASSGCRRRALNLVPFNNEEASVLITVSRRTVHTTLPPRSNKA
jgi:hypothetical protein